MNNSPLIIGLLCTVILSLYCVDFYTEPILQKLNQKSAQKNSSKTIKQQLYIETMAKSNVSKVISKEEEFNVKKESELDILAKKILEDMKKNKDNRWRQ